jgi:hypothetical protein
MLKLVQVAIKLLKAFKERNEIGGDLRVGGRARLNDSLFIK